MLPPPAGAAPEEEYDPHVWFDVSLWTSVVDAVRDGLAALDPGNAAQYRQRADRYRSELEALDEQICRWSRCITICAPCSPGSSTRCCSPAPVVATGDVRDVLTRALLERAYGVALLAVDAEAGARRWTG